MSLGRFQNCNVLKMRCFRRYGVEDESGVPAAVFAEGGPKFLVEPGVTGIRAETDEEFVAQIAALVRDRPKLAELRSSVLSQKLDRTWDGVFEDVYAAYRAALCP